MKKCTICKLLKACDAFNKKVSNKDGLQTKCRECSSLSAKLRYKANHKKELVRIKSRQQQIAKRFVDFKSDLQCIRCAENCSCCLEFHHLDPKQKDFNIAQVAKRGYSWERLMEEVKKCVVLCANCHRKLHAGLIVIEESSNGRMQLSES